MSIDNPNEQFIPSNDESQKNYSLVVEDICKYKVDCSERAVLQFLIYCYSTIIKTDITYEQPDIELFKKVLLKFQKIFIISITLKSTKIIKNFYLF